MKLHALHIKDVHGFLDQAFLLGRSNTFLGVNGAGKTRLLDLLEKLLQREDSYYSKSTLFLKIEGESIHDFSSIQIQNEDPQQTGYGNQDDYLFSELFNCLHRWQRLNFAKGQNSQASLIDSNSSDVEKDRNLRIGGRMLDFFNYLESTPYLAAEILPKKDAGFENFWTIFKSRFLAGRSLEFTNQLLQTCLSNTFLAISGENRWHLYGVIPHSYFDSLDIKSDLTDVFSTLNFPFNSLGDAFINSSENIMTESGFIEVSVYVDETGVYIPLLGVAGRFQQDQWFNGEFLRTVVPKIVRANSDFSDIQRRIEESILNIAVNLHYSLMSMPSHSWLVESHDGGKTELSPYIYVASRWFVQRVNQCLPSFISDEFKFSVSLFDPWEWEANEMKKCIGSLSRPRQLSPSLFSDGNFSSLIPDEFKIEDMGSGISSWTSVAISIATSSLLEDGLLLEFDQSILKATDEDNFVSSLLTQIFDQSPLESVKLPMRTISYLAEQISEDSIPGTIEFQSLRSALSILSRAKLDSSSSSEAVLIVDEPEANLHPAALISITQWLVDTSSGMTGSLVATHSPKIFDAQLNDAKKFYISRLSNSDHKSFVNMFPNDGSALHPWAEELGVTTGELFLMTKKWLIVEGLFDQKILYIWFKELFSKRGIRCISARGTNGVDHTMQMDVLAGLCASVAVLLDTPVKQQEIDYDKLLRQKMIKDLLPKGLSDGDPLSTKKLDPAKVELVSAEHSKFDIWFFLDASLVVKLGGLEYKPKNREKWEFDDWDTAWSKFQEHRTKTNEGVKESESKYIRNSVKSFKGFMRVEYGLNMESNLKLAEKVAKKMLQKRDVPQELDDIIKWITTPGASTDLNNTN